MSSEIVVPETPNWLQELEAKREKRLKARLGHEAGAGAPCLKCEEKCPGLDLHFWRKCCKVCKCSKEEHEVQDDDIYGWAQFQLLGSKPTKMKQKIVLPGRKDEIDLDWTPKGNKETVDKYLKTLPPDQLPITGSQAARDRKQLLQKQIPIHDIDPNLCHELDEKELAQMNEYITHVKQNSVGVGQIVSLSNIIKGNLHMLSPADAEMIAKRYAKEIPLSEIVKLQSQRMAGSLKHPELSKTLEMLSFNNRNLPNFDPKSLSLTEDTANSVILNKVHDMNYPMYPTPQSYNRNTNNRSENDQPSFDQTIDEKFLRNSKFDPKNRPSQFNPPSVPYQSREEKFSARENDTEYKTGNSAFVPYKKAPIVNQQNTLTDPSYAKNIEGSRGYNPADSRFSGAHTPMGNYFIEDGKVQNPEYSKDIEYDREGIPQGATFRGADHQNLIERQYPPGHIANIEPSQSFTGQNSNKPSGSPSYSSIREMGTERLYENVNDLRQHNGNLPNYIPGKYNVVSEHQSPQKVPNSFKDLAFSTYGTTNPSEEAVRNEFQYGQYRQPGSYPAGTNPNDSGGPAKSREFRPIKTADNQHLSNKNSAAESSDDKQNTKVGETDSQSDQNVSVFPSKHQKFPHGMNQPTSNEMHSNNPNSLDNPQDFIKTLQKIPTGTQNIEQLAGCTPVPNAQNSYPYHPGGKLSEKRPVTRGIREDFLYPSQVNIGLIQDINYPEIKAATHGTNDFYEDYSPDSIRELINNIQLPDCHYCKKAFEENEFAVTIDRAKALFHADCFKCFGCNQILADQVYFYHKESDNVYCLRDYAKIRGFPRCKACDELIFTKEYCLADDATFHLKHFCCIECDKPLAGQDYTLDEEMPYCLPCFEQSKASKCSSCYKAIKPDEEGCTLNGVHFHPVDECFACLVCKKPLMGKKLLLRNEKLYCSFECYDTVK